MIQSMIQSMFVALRGIGEQTERKLWERGVGNWEAFLASERPAGISLERKKTDDGDLV